MSLFKRKKNDILNEEKELTPEELDIELQNYKKKTTLSDNNHEKKSVKDASNVTDIKLAGDSVFDIASNSTINVENAQEEAKTQSQPKDAVIPDIDFSKKSDKYNNYKEYKDFYKPKSVEASMHYIVISKSFFSKLDCIYGYRTTLENILEYSISKMIKFFIVGDISCESEYIFYRHAEGKNFIKDLSSLLDNTDSKNSAENVDALKIVYQNVKDMELCKNKVDINKVTYEIKNISITFIGNECLYYKENVSKLKEQITYLSKHSDISYYMTVDETERMASIGFRNLYLLNRNIMEGVE